MENSGILNILKSVKDSTTLKLIVIGVLVLVLLIPQFMVSDLIEERQERRSEVEGEMVTKWGGEQKVSGFVLSVPIKDGNSHSEGEFFHILPKNLSISGDVNTQLRAYGIYEIPVYSSKLLLKGSVELPSLEEWGLKADMLDWSRCYVSCGVSDLKGMKERPQVTIGDKSYELRPGTDISCLKGKLLGARIPVNPDEDFSFEVDLQFNGSKSISFFPLGDVTTVALKSNWPHPSFSGSFIPLEKTVPTEKGFSADWKVLSHTRSYPQAWLGDDSKMDDTSIDVGMVMVADNYQRSTRTTKYAVLFVVFAFTAFFISEMMNKRRIHPIQYFLVGAAMVVFYVLLLAFSEHVSFNKAYIVATVAIVLLISGYAKAIMKSALFAFSIMGMLTLLYGCLFVILQMEDMALLFGSVGLFVTLAALMYITSKVNWYSEASQETPQLSGGLIK